MNYRFLFSQPKILELVVHHYKQTRPCANETSRKYKIPISSLHRPASIPWAVYIGTSELLSLGQFALPARFADHPNSGVFFPFYSYLIDTSLLNISLVLIPIPQKDGRNQTPQRSNQPCRAGAPPHPLPNPLQPRFRSALDLRPRPHPHFSHARR